ncbi:MAG TPA: L-rhamnosyltransferase, partial [Gammaproteobacteria bacterium]|nr:L-rhamnosyltransferase [Gammaproteobacteria bacterium]
MGARNFSASMDNSQPPRGAVAAVVTTYQPDLQTLEAQFARLDGQVDSLLVIDNGSADAQQVAELVARYPSARFIGATENRGLGWAHNKGLKRALDEGADAVLLLDQDSLPSKGMVDALRVALKKQRQQGVQTAAVGARYLGTDQGHPSYFVQFGRLHFRRCFCSSTSASRLIRADMLISSGTLFAREALEAVGLMDEGLFIDHLDTEWFLRAGARGWQSFGVCDALMDHGLGDRTVRVWLGRWRYLPVHKPFRYYYVYRNSLLLWRR